MLVGVATPLGSADISVSEVYAAILARFFPAHFHTTWFADTIVWKLRRHRVLMDVVAGMGLAVAGAVMQGILKNLFIASPFTLGIASATGFVGGEYLIVGNAFEFTLLASFTVYGLAKYKGITRWQCSIKYIDHNNIFDTLSCWHIRSEDRDADTGHGHNHQNRNNVDGYFRFSRSMVMCI